LVPFTGTTVGFARLLDIVHMVPLANAHRSGACAWSSQNKGDYFNNLSFDGHLIAVALTVVRSRGASGPEDWQPPNMGYWCEYAVNWIQVKAAWNLTATADEWSALEKMLGTCSADLAIEIGEPRKHLPVAHCQRQLQHSLQPVRPRQLRSQLPSQHQHRSQSLRPSRYQGLLQRRYRRLLPRQLHHRPLLLRRPKRQHRLPLPCQPQRK